MNKKNKIIIAIGIIIIIAATVLIITLVDGMGENEPTGSSGPYTLQPTTKSTTIPDTNSWVDLNLIASDLATATDTSNVSESGGVITTAGPVQGYFFDSFGNLVDAQGNIIVPANQFGNNQGSNGGEQNQNTDPVTFPDNTEALDKPVNDDENQLGEFEIDSNGIITKYLGDKENVLIPQKEQGREVTGIGESCFEGTYVKTVYIPATVTYIGNFAFRNCPKLTTVSFVSSDTKVVIGTGAFENCGALKTINLPVVSTLGNTAFNKCSSLEIVRFADGSKKIGNYSFADCPNLTTVVIPQSVDSIGTNAFNGFNKDKLTIVTPADSTAWDYAVNSGIKHTTHE